jgi:sugar phosphate isomerase/epimerase
VIISVRATSPAARWISTVPRHVLESAAGAVADIGLRIAVEAFAWSAINSVPTTSALLARANASNAGHLLDVWHFYNTGSTTESITDLDVATVAAVQLNDGPRVHDYFREGAISTSAA